jgi:hypothetical protein
VYFFGVVDLQVGMTFAHGARLAADQEAKPKFEVMKSALTV